MAYTTTDLINRAFYLSQVVSRELETVSGQQIEDGLLWLNAILSMKSVHSRLIPYFKQYNFNAVAGQEKYNVPNLVDPETLTFNIGPVRYSTMSMSRRPYFGSGRVDNVGSLPFNWHFERVLNGSDIYLYFIPDTNYPITIWGKFGFDEVFLGDDLLLTFDAYYIDYLRYRLALKICAEYGIPMQPQALNELQEMEDQVTDISPNDLSISKVSCFTGNNGLNWGDINTGKGWRPGN